MDVIIFSWRRARDRAESRHRRTRARCRGGRGRCACRRRRKRLQRPRRRLGFLPRELGESDQRRRCRDHEHGAPPCRVLVGRADDDLASTEARRLRTRRRRPLLRLGGRFAAFSERAWRRRTSPDGRALAAAPSGRTVEQVKVGAGPIRCRSHRRAQRHPRSSVSGRRSRPRSVVPTGPCSSPSPRRSRWAPARQSRLSGAVQLTDAGEGAGPWQVVDTWSPGSTGRAALALPTTVPVPGRFATRRSSPPVRAPGADRLHRAPTRSGRAPDPVLGSRFGTGPRATPTADTGRVGVYRSTTAGRPALVTRYRYPEAPSGVGVTTTLRGPERAFRFRISSRVANAGVVVTDSGRRSRRAADRRGARRDPPHRIRGSPHEPQPVHGHLPRAAACRRVALAGARRLRSRLRQRRAAGRRYVQVPLLGERRHPSDAAPAHPRGRRRATRTDLGHGCRLRGLPRLARRHG